MNCDDLLAGRACAPLSPRALWKLTGPDRIRFLNGQTTQDIATLRPGQSAHAAVTNAKGKMDGEVWITAREHELWIDAPIGLRESLGQRLERYLIADDAQLEDITGSHELYHRILPQPDLPNALSHRFLLPGQDDWLAPGCPPPLPLATPESVEALRILQAVPLWGQDIGPHLLPPEAAFERDAISYRKGCYIGQEVIARIKSIGHVNKRLVQLLCTADVVPPPLPAPVLSEDKLIGELTSACRHPHHPGCIGLAVLPRTLAETPTTVTIARTPWQTRPLVLT